MSASDLARNTGSTLKSLVKIVLQCRRCTVPRSRRNEPLIVLANGPSLNDTIASHLDILKANDTMTVNFAPITDVFTEIRPKWHTMADPLFFAADAPENIHRLYDSLARVDWPLTLVVPRRYRKRIPAKVLDNSNITVSCFNFVGLEGYAWFERMVYGRRMGMPKPRNVLVPALMCGIWAGYDRLYVVGADHSWMQTIRVDENNHVISVQPHFYKDDKSEQQRVDTTYRNYRLHDIVHSFYTAFRSYHRVQDFASRRRVEIVNCTPESFIDAFARGKLDEFL